MKRQEHLSRLGRDIMVGALMSPDHRNKSQDSTLSRIAKMQEAEDAFVREQEEFQSEAERFLDENQTHYQRDAQHTFEETQEDEFVRRQEEMQLEGERFLAESQTHARRSEFPATFLAATPEQQQLMVTQTGDRLCSRIQAVLAESGIRRVRAPLGKISYEQRDMPAAGLAGRIANMIMGPLLSLDKRSGREYAASYLVKEVMPLLSSERLLKIWVMEMLQVLLEKVRGGLGFVHHLNGNWRGNLGQPLLNQPVNEEDAEDQFVREQDEIQLEGDRFLAENRTHYRRMVEHGISGDF